MVVGIGEYQPCILFCIYYIGSHFLHYPNFLALCFRISRINWLPHIANVDTLLWAVCGVGGSLLVACFFFVWHKRKRRKQARAPNGFMRSESSMRSFSYWNLEELRRTTIKLLSYIYFANR